MPTLASCVPALVPSSSRLTFLCPQIDYMQYTIDNAPIERGENYALAKQFGQTLVENCREMLGQAPLYKDSEYYPHLHPPVHP